MKPLKPIVASICIILLCNYALAQSKLNAKFGDISVKDFSPISPVVDSSSDAVVLLDIGSTDFDGNNSGFFTLIFKEHERILIRKRNAFDEATVKILLRSGTAQSEDRFDDFEASTYNLENGQIVETKIDKKSIFKEKYNRSYYALKFTLPNIKEGSIIEYKYTLKTPFNRSDIKSWAFQQRYPVLWSEYKVIIPPIYNYATIKQGFTQYAIDTGGRIYKSYSILDPGDATSGSTVLNLSGDAKWAWWAQKDVPAFKEEQYMTSSKNYISKIKFQLHSIDYSSDHHVQVLKSWMSTAEDLLNDEDFGKPLEDGNSWLTDELKKITGNSTGLEKASKIFCYVRDNFSCTDDNDEIYLSQTLKKTFQTKKGSVADINLLLTAMLINQGYDAHPVILSTRDNGKATESTAFLYQYNYVISRVKIDSSYYLLDGSVNRLGFGKLSENCYNGSARLIDKIPYLIPLSTDSLSEAKSTMVFIANDEKENAIDGSYTSNLGYLESLSMRDKIAKSKKEDVIKEIEKGYSSDIELSNMEIDSIKSYDDPVEVKHDFKIKFDEDVVYFSPMFGDIWKNNPFTSEKRSYPVEMPYKMNELYTLNMEIPKGYKIDELPKSARIKLNENDGMFEYLLANSGDAIQFRIRLVLNKANFDPDDYQTLRDFFSYVVKKEAEQIVFKKIK